jgi:two-component system response regulator CssR
MSYSIYLVEDETKLNSLLRTYLEREGYKITTFYNGNDAIKQINTPPDLWVLDIMLPDIDGYEVLKRIKEVDDMTPIIFMSARDTDIDRLLGLQLGSEDYISKPFLPQELVLRCNNIIKRIYGINSKNVINYEDYQILIDKRIIMKNNEEIMLTTKEFDLLILFLNNFNKSLTREQILDNVWGHDYFGSDRVVDDLIRRLKKKCSDLKINTLYGYGYRLV